MSKTKNETSENRSGIKSAEVHCYLEMDTDELLEHVPDNLHLARNGNAPDHDRWRMYNSYTEKYVEPGFGSARELLLVTLIHLEEQMKSWTGR